jgi:hypothetical protein
METWMKTKKEEEEDINDDTTTKSAFQARQKVDFYIEHYTPTND